MKRILFFHNTLMPYRTPFFRILDNLYNIRLVFKQIEIAYNLYKIDISPEIQKIKFMNYNILKNHFRYIKIINELLKQDYDVIVDSLEFNCILSFIYAKIMRKPIILWTEDWGGDNSSIRRKISSKVSKIIANYSDALIVPGSKHKEYLISLDVTCEKIFIVPNISDINENDSNLTINNLRTKFKIDNKKIILYVGRLVERKGIDFLLNAFTKLRNEFDNVLLIIVGDGNYKKNLEFMTKQLGISDSVYFVGQVENKDLDSYYSICNICVIPSVSSKMKDPWVFVVNEAMYFGKPVIVSDAVGAAFDMVKKGENGFIVPEKDVDELFISMKTIISDLKLEKKMGFNSKKIIEDNFRYENMIDGFKEAVAYVMDGE
ncbi:glycosyltransferase family 4 protein [Methanobacterium sp.]|uniref:glycosyltransferase family 4 protein n=1 Tax=Methanobacterium sp. TaxID=2164 RepID=UPI003158FC2F